MKKIIIGIIVLAVIALGVWKYQTRPMEPVSGKPVVKVAFVMPMSGNAGAYGESAQVAAQLFMDKLPTDSFFDYKIIFEDTRGKLEDVANITNRITKTDKVDVIVSFLSGSGFIVSGMNKGEFLHFGIGSDAKIAHGPYNFFMTSNIRKGSKIVLNDMQKNKIEKIDVLTVNTSGAKTITDIFLEEINKQKGISIINQHTVNPEEKDFRMLIEKIVSENPQAIFVNLTNRPTQDIFLKQYKEKNIKIPLYGVDVFSFLDDKNLGEGMKSAGLATANLDFIQKYKAIAHSETLNYAEYFAIFLDLIYISYEETKTTDKDIVAKSILNHCTDSAILGEMECDDEGVMMNKHVPFQMIKDGKIVDIEE